MSVGLAKMALLGLILMLLVSNTGYSQTAQGSITGTVTDTKGAVVGGGTVEILNQTTGDKRTAATNDGGQYSFPNLPLGVYSVTVSAAGFASTTVKDVKISVSFATKQDVVINAAGSNETVVVTTQDTQTQVNTTDQQLSTLLDNKKIIDLPLLNRDPNSLILLAPGTIQTQSGLGGFSVNGSRERNNNFLVDGIDNNDTEVPGIPGGLASPNIDATQEFRVVTSNFNAELGRNTGAIVLLATKAGTNSFHGAAYIYYRSDAFSARDFFDISGNADQLQRKQFGFSLGGPIIKDKLFFFSNYEGDRFNFGTQEIRTVPSASARTGILNTPAPQFGGCDQADGKDALAGRCGTLDIRQAGFNNNTGNNLGRQLPFNTAIVPLLSIYPLGNDPADSPVPGVFDAFRFSYSNRNHQDSNATRIDYHVSEKHALAVSYNFNTGVFAAGPDTFPGTGDGIRSPQRGQLLSLNFTSTFTPSLVNEFRAGFNRAKARFNGNGDGGVSSLISDKINAAFSAAGVPLAKQFGGVNGETINLSNGAITGLGTFDTQFRFTGTTTLGDSLTWIRGNHTLKMGAEQRWSYANSATNFGRSESLDLAFPSEFGFPILRTNSGGDINPIGIAGSYSNYASFLYGIVSQQSQSQFFDKTGNRKDENYDGFRTREFEVFFQDTWKVRSNLTLNYGLRWEYKGVPYEVNGQFSTLVNQNPSLPEPSGGFKFQLVGKNSGGSSNLYQNDYNNFGPRFGFNFSPDSKEGLIAKMTGGPGKTSIRGGYGIFYDRVFGNLFTNARGNPPFEEDFFTLPIVDTATGTLQEFARPTTLKASTTVPSGAEIFPVIFALPGNNIVQGKLATPYEQKWNFGFQRELGNQFLIEADYVGAKGTDELREIDGQMTSVPRCNALFPTICGGPISSSGTNNLFNGRANDSFLEVALNTSLGFSTYNSLQTRITKTLTNSHFGLGQIQGAYTWSHSIDNSTDALVAQPGERSFPRDSSGFAGGFSGPERGDSGFDVRHRLSVNFIYEFPFKFENGLENRVLGNWEISGIWSAQTGLPYSVFGSVDSAGTGVSQRANFASPGNPNDITPTTLPPNPRVQTGPDRTIFANPTRPAGSSPKLGVQGIVGRNTFRGPGFNKFDFSLIKRIPITENVKLRFQADFFNAFNRVNFGLPVNTITSANFGRSTFTVGTPRVIQFAARLDF